MISPELITPEDSLISGATFVQVRARLTAALASTSPKPYLSLIQKPVPPLFRDQPASPTSMWREVFTRIYCTSRAVRSGLASSIRAITPATTGVAEDVPPKSAV